MKTILSHANLIDCVEPQVRPDTAVLIEDGRIRAILPSGEAGSAGDDAQMIDLKGGYLMPGLWDVHIHPDYLSLDEMPLADQVTLFGHRLATALTESGIVGLRCAGAHHFMGEDSETASYHLCDPVKAGHFAAGPASGLCLDEAGRPETCWCYSDEWQR